MHYFAYPGNPSFGLYGFMVFGVNVPWTLSCVRHFIVVPNNPLLRVFCIVYDVLILKPFFRNHVILMFFSYNGFSASVYFPLMLLDIINNSNVLNNVVRSVGSNAAQLSWVLYLFVVTVVIYAQFGLENFEDGFMFEGANGEDVGCHSAVGCCLLIFYRGIPGGGLGDVMAPVERTEGDFFARMAFDLLFFAWVGVILFNVITSLMVDGFWTMRAADTLRQDVLENTCFVCGFTRVKYVDIPHFRGPTFEYHKDTSHAFLKYVYFWVYLKRKEATDMTGAESHVWKLIQDDLDLGWIPVRNCAAVQAAAARTCRKSTTPIMVPGAALCARSCLTQ